MIAYVCYHRARLLKTVNEMGIRQHVSFDENLDTPIANAEDFICFLCLKSVETCFQYETKSLETHNISRLQMQLYESMNERNNVRESEETNNNLHVAEGLIASIKQRYRFDSSTKRFISSFILFQLIFAKISLPTVESIFQRSSSRQM